MNKSDIHNAEKTSASGFGVTDNVNSLPVSGRPPHAIMITIEMSLVYS
jgi:hypothetical protein